MSSIRTASVMLLPLLTAPAAFAVLTPGERSLADDATSIKEYFIAKNPKDGHAQFQNTNIHLIYGCIFARGVDPTVVDLDATIGQEDAEAVPGFGDIGESFAKRRLASDAGTMVGEPGPPVRDQWC